MSDYDRPKFPRDPEPLPQDSISRLLQLGGRRAERPVDALIARLEQSDRDAWLDAALRQGALAGAGDPSDVLCSDETSVAQLQMMKERSKSILQQHAAGEEHLAALAGYFLSIAAAMRHHGASITGRDWDEVAEVLLDLATVSPEPISRMLGEAAMRGSEQR